jgi:SET domain-containing protein
MILVLVVRDIKKGEEVGVDYGERFRLHGTDTQGPRARSAAARGGAAANASGAAAAGGAAAA